MRVIPKRMIAKLRERVLRNVVDSEEHLSVDGRDLGPCWLWQRRVTDEGYPRMSVRLGQGDPVAFYAHRVAYAIFRGKLKSNLTLDHLCVRPFCCNPWHCKQVTRAQNTSVAHARRKFAGGRSLQAELTL